MSQILGSRCALQDLAGELLVGHPLKIWGECSERKSFLSPVSTSYAHTPPGSTKTRQHHPPTAPLYRENSFLSVGWEEPSAPIRPAVARHPGAHELTTAQHLLGKEQLKGMLFEPQGSKLFQFPQRPLCRDLKFKGDQSLWDKESRKGLDSPQIWDSHG